MQKSFGSQEISQAYRIETIWKTLIDRLTNDALQIQLCTFTVKRQPMNAVSCFLCFCSHPITPNEHYQTIFVLFVFSFVIVAFAERFLLLLLLLYFFIASYWIHFDYTIFELYLLRVQIRWICSAFCYQISFQIAHRKSLVVNSLIYWRAINFIFGISYFQMKEINSHLNCKELAIKNILNWFFFLEFIHRLATVFLPINPFWLAMFFFSFKKNFCPNS